MMKLQPALDTIERALAMVEHPYIAFSGGKDSLVVMHLVHQVDPDVPMVYCDDELLYPEHVEYIVAAKAHYGDQLRIVQGQGLHGGWFRPWKYRQQWWRQPHREMEWLNWRPTGGVGGSELATRLGYDSVFLGLRRQESLRRQALLEGKSPIERLSGVTYINPIIDWADWEVWEHIYFYDLPYCAAYTRLEEIGVHEHHARVAPLPLAQGKHLWKGWIRLYIDLQRRYGRRWTVPGRRRPPEIKPLDWIDLQEVLGGKLF